MDKYTMEQLRKLVSELVRQVAHLKEEHRRLNNQLAKIVRK